MSRKSDLLKYGVSALLAVLLLYLSFRGVGWSDFINALLDCRWEWIAVAMAAGVAAFWVRAVRWRQLLSPLDDAVPRKAVFNAVNIGYLVNLALPRAGELVRCGFLAKHCKRAGYDKILGTVVLERLWDVLMMFLLVAVLAVAMWGRFGNFLMERIVKPFSGRIDLSLGMIVAILLFLCAGMLWLVYCLKGKWRPAAMVWRFVKGLAEGVSSCFRMRRWWLFFLYSAAIWALYWLMSLSILYSVQEMDVPGLSSLGPVDALFLMLAGSLSSLVPVPGGFGAFHYIVALALSSVYGIPFEIGIVFATLSHESQTLTMILCGSASYVSESMSIVSGNNPD